MTSTSEDYWGLSFSFADVLSEIESMRNLAGELIDSNSMHAVIPQFQQNLSNIRSSKMSGSQRWEILESNPIRTVVSEGKFEKGNRKGASVYGEVSTLWEIAPSKQQFVLEGNASTKLRVFEYLGEGQPGDAGAGQEIACWRFEVGVRSSPGCHFHTQVLGEKEEVVGEARGDMFPHRLSIPRLPSLLITPMDGLDFLLGELFQDRWQQKSVELTNHHLRTWAGCQRERLGRLLRWKLATIESEDGSPWMVLKRKKPPQDMLFEKSREKKR